MSIVTSFDLLKHRRTKIVATLGPRTRDPASIRALLEAGVDVFRLNMSHGTQDEHAEAIVHIRRHAAELGLHAGILADLCGPKIRTGRFEASPLTLAAGAEITVTTRDVVGNATLIPSQYAQLAHDVRPGDRVLLNDGAVELKVRAIDGSEVHCVVVSGGPIGNHKGINLPGVRVSAPSMTDKDVADAAFALAQGVDFLALSFVRERADVDSLRAIVERHEHRPAIIAKIEKPEALENSLAILEAADAIMVARGDLGVEMPAERVPAIQKRIVGLCRKKGKPVIVATQMLESMIASPVPTRAEASDVATAIYDGADAVMLSAESAAGQYPIEAVDDDEPPDHRGRSRRPVPAADQRIARRQRNQCRHRLRGVLRRAACRRAAAGGSDRLLHKLAEARHRAPTGAGLGRSCPRNARRRRY